MDEQQESQKAERMPRNKDLRAGLEVIASYDPGKAKTIAMIALEGEDARSFRGLISSPLAIFLGVFVVVVVIGLLVATIAGEESDAWRLASAVLPAPLIVAGFWYCFLSH